MNELEKFKIWFSGLVDGEGCFTSVIREGSINFRFKINLRADDKSILFLIKDYLGFGKVVYEPYIRRKTFINGNPQYKYVIYNREDRQKIIDLLTKYPLRTKKKKDFDIWVKLHNLERNNLKEGERLVRELHEVKKFS